MATELEIVMQWRGCRVRKTVLTSVLVSSSRRVDVTTPMRPWVSGALTERVS